MPPIRNFIVSALLFVLTTAPFLVSGICRATDGNYAVFPGNKDCYRGKKVVLICGDEEYRSEEEMTQLAKILSQYHGFDCVVLYAIDPETGEITPTVVNNIPGMAELRDADLMVLFLRFRQLPDEQMEEFEAYLKSGRPILAQRTSTHAFQYPPESRFARYDWRFADPQGEWEWGFGRKILGESWIDHHGHHNVEGTRTVTAPGEEANPLLNGCGSYVVPTDVYTVRLPLPGDCHPIILGAVIDTLDESGKSVDAKNDPMMPVAWTKTYQVDSGPIGKAIVTTMGSGPDFLAEGFRRFLVNSVYRLCDLDIPERAEVNIIGEYHPLWFGFGKFRPGIKP